MKTTQIQIRVSIEQKNQIRAASERAHIDMSQWILEKLFPKPRAHFLDLLAQLKNVQNKQERRFVLNDLNAFLASLDKDGLHTACGEAHDVELNDLMDNYVAAMVEIACMAKEINCPPWLTEKTGCRTPFFGSDLPSLRLYLLLSSPPGFRSRNIFIDSSIGDLI